MKWKELAIPSKLHRKTFQMGETMYFPSLTQVGHLRLLLKKIYIKIHLLSSTQDDVVVDRADGRRVDRSLCLVGLQLLQRVSVPKDGTGILKYSHLGNQGWGVGYNFFPAPAPRFFPSGSGS